MTRALAYGYAYNLTDDNGEQKREEAINNLQISLERPGAVWNAEPQGRARIHEPMPPAVGHTVNPDEVEWSEQEVLGIRTLQATYRFEHPGAPE